MENENGKSKFSGGVTFLLCVKEAFDTYATVFTKVKPAILLYSD